MVSMEMVGKEILETLKKVSASQQRDLAGEILRAKRIFVAGAGRSGMMARCFAMRLMHLGLNAYMTGEVVTPAFSHEDLLIVASGSGSTGSLVQMGKKAKEIGGRVALVTICPESIMGEMADILVEIHAPIIRSDISTGDRSLQPMGNLFEQCLLVTLDYVVMLLMEELGMTVDEMFVRHANLE